MKLWKFVSLLVLCVVCSSGLVNAQIVRTIAGRGINDSSSGDYGAATAATMGQVFSVATDPSGNLYICDNSFNNIRKVDTRGIITTIAGDVNGYPSFAGDGGPSTASRLSAPYSLDCDAAGNLYIADAGNRRIRKISPSGTITTIAGSGGVGYHNGDGISALSAVFGSPAGISIDASGNLYIADAAARIRRVDASGIIWTSAGNGTIGYRGNGGQATAASLDGPTSACSDGRGNIFLCDKNNNVVRFVKSTGVINNYAGNNNAGFTGDGGPGTTARVRAPNACRSDRWGNIYIADQNNGRIRIVDTSRIIRTFAGRTDTVGFSGDGGPATAAVFANPSDICFDSRGNVYIADKNNYRVRQVFWVDTFHIMAYPGDTICGRSTIYFRANLVNPYYNSKIIWRRNGSVVGGDSIQYTPSSLTDGDVITCSIVDPAYGAMTLAVSDTVRMVIRSAVYPRLRLGSSTESHGDSLCAGQTITLTAFPSNEGPSPTYTWQRFGVTLASGPSRTFTYAPSPGDIIVCVLQSSATCAIPDTANASRSMVVNISYPPEISVDAHPGTTISYYGQIVTLLSELTYEGSAPRFQWYRNGRAIAGATNSSFSEEVYYNDTLYCVMHSNLPCVVPETDTSNVVYISVGRVGVESVILGSAGFSVFPNPAVGGKMTLTGLDDLKNGDQVTVSLRDIDGKMVWSAQLTSTSNDVLTVQVPDHIGGGIYYLSIATAGKVRSRSVVLAR